LSQILIPVKGEGAIGEIDKKPVRSDAILPITLVYGLTFIS